MSEAPSRIWFTNVRGDIVPNSYRVCDDDAEYILSTPVREAAPDLLDALEGLLGLWQQMDRATTLEEIAAEYAIAKAKGTAE